MNLPVDWPAVIERVAATPPPQLGRALEPLLGGSTVSLWIWDHQRRGLTRLSDAEWTPIGDIDSLIDGPASWAPLLFLGDDVGVLTIDSDQFDRRDVAGLARLLAAAVVAGDRAIDTIDRRRRRREMALPAQLQWSLLPPASLRLGSLDLTAAIEPAYDTGGDIFDYSIDRGRLFLAVLDARGHGLRASMTSAVAASAMRRARRHGLSLAEIAREIDVAVGAIGDDVEFVTAVLAEVDLETWTGSWLSAGHLPPLRVNIEGCTSLPLIPTLPLGMTINGESSNPTVQQFTLTPNESLVLFSDGVIENLRAEESSDEQPGEALFRASLHADVPREHDADGAHHRARGVVETLIEHSPALRDDATLLIARRRDAPTA